MKVEISSAVLYNLYNLSKTKLKVLKNRSTKCNAGIGCTSVSTRLKEYEEFMKEHFELHKVMIDNKLLTINYKTRKRLAKTGK